MAPRPSSWLTSSLQQLSRLRSAPMDNPETSGSSAGFRLMIRFGILRQFCPCMVAQYSTQVRKRRARRLIERLDSRHEERR
jgi:hypothetical protein